MIIWNERGQAADLDPNDPQDKSIIASLTAHSEYTYEQWTGTPEDIDSYGENHPNDIVEALEIKFVTTNFKTYYGTIIVTGTGGPHVELNTMDKKVHLYWWGDHYSINIDSELCNRLDAYFEAYYEALNS